MYLVPARSRRLAPSSRPHGPFWPGALERPSATEPISGHTTYVVGWAWPFVDERVRSVELLIDAVPAGTALLTLRPDMAESMGRPEAALSGFEARVEIPAAARERGWFQVSARVNGLQGGSWDIPRKLVRMERAASPADASPSPADAPPPPARGDLAEPSPAGLSPVPGPVSKDRDLQRRRLGYDPWHVVVLIEGPNAIAASGPAIAALDVLAERHPNLELLISGVRPESVAADLLRRTITAMGLEDRVTVPRSEEEPGYWRSVADLRLGASKATDLATVIDRLVTADRRGRRQD